MLRILKFKKIIAFILVVITLMSITQPIFAASGTGKWVGGQFASFIKTTDNDSGNYWSYIYLYSNNKGFI